MIVVCRHMDERERPGLTVRDGEIQLDDIGLLQRSQDITLCGRPRYFMKHDTVWSGGTLT
jgi:hypothetical protein